MIEREISGERLRGHTGEEEAFATLLHEHRPGANRSHVPRAEIFPMEHLAGIERAREVEVVHRCLCQPHEDLSHRLTRINTDWPELASALS
jgi:hypothetical protein